MAKGYKRDSRGRFSGGNGAGALGGKGAYASRVPRGQGSSSQRAARGTAGSRQGGIKPVSSNARRSASILRSAGAAGVFGLAAGVSASQGRTVSSLVYAAGAAAAAQRAVSKPRPSFGTKKRR